ncbi:MAG TPA: hypothetical protein VHM01_21630 [Alphaproteobacteria bacterium]|nr:hypothetical protein [Alphaproteobacteria bacterium]
MSKAKTTTVEIGQVYEKVGAPRPQWRVAKIIQHREGPHALLVSLEDPTRQITLASTALLDTRMATRVADFVEGGKDVKPWDSLETDKPAAKSAA